MGELTPQLASGMEVIVSPYAHNLCLSQPPAVGGADPGSRRTGSAHCHGRQHLGEPAPAPCLDSAVEMTLVVGTQVSQLRGCEHKRDSPSTHPHLP